MLIKNSGLGLYGRGGHNHNDNLSFILLKNGKEFITDPATYTYTGDPDSRNIFRSTAMHNTPQAAGKEINPFGEPTEELFWYRGDKANPKVSSHTENSWIGSHSGYSKKTDRAFILSPDKLLIKDKYHGKQPITSRLHLHPRVSARPTGNGIELHENGKWFATVNCDSELMLNEYWFSPTYGRKVKSVVIIAESPAGELNWSIAL